MLSSILKFLAGIGVALGWAKQKDDQTTGALVQRGADDQVALKESADVQKADYVSGAGGVPSIRAELLKDARP